MSRGRRTIPPGATLLGALQAALGAEQYDGYRGDFIPQSAPRRNRPTSKYMPHQGAKECARRRDQLAAGFLRSQRWVAHTNRRGYWL